MLQIIADVLTTVCDRNNAFAFRNGGNEFTMITDKADEGLVEKICKEVEDELEMVCFRDDLKIKMSPGISKFDGNSTIAQLKSRADESLYDVKRVRKAER